jgi:hypothetical protein
MKLPPSVLAQLLHVRPASHVCPAYHAVLHAWPACLAVLQMAPVLRSSVSFIAAHLLSLPHSAAAQLCTLEGCLLDKLAKVSHNMSMDGSDD